jgi:hypothetical protein
MNLLLYALIPLAIILISFVTYYFSRIHLRKLIASCTRRSNLSARLTSEQIPTEIIPFTHEVQINPNLEQKMSALDDAQIRFSTYSIHSG